MSKNDFSISYAAILIDAAVEYGADRAALIDSVNLKEELLINPDSRISEKQFRTLNTNAKLLSNRPEVFLHFGEQLTLTSHGAVGYAIMSCRNMGQAIDILAKYYRLLLHDSDMIINITKDHINIEYFDDKTSIENPISNTEVFFAGFLSAIRHLLHIDKIDADVFCAYAAPSYTSSYDDILNCRVHFDADINKIVLPKSILEEKPEYANPVMLKMFEQQCDEMLARMQSREGLHNDVREYLIAAIQPLPSLQQCADNFHMSTRTFRRKLEGEDTSYQSVLDEVRQELAETYLRNPAISVSHTADLIGFHDVSNFRRAFIRWTGISPSAYKKQFG
jgi:AraC-like DNA-binding protein